MNRRLLIALFAVCLYHLCSVARVTDSIAHPNDIILSEKFTQDQYLVDDPEMEDDDDRFMMRDEDAYEDDEDSEKNKLLEQESQQKSNNADKFAKYPKFIRFCANVVDWFNNTFCYYDPEYIEKGKSGKVVVNTDDWCDFYIFKSENAPRINMQSTLYSNIGAKIGYSIISVGYSIDIPTLFNNQKTTHKKWDFSINTALLSLNIHYWNNYGSSYISSYGKFKFNDTEQTQLSFDGLKFVNAEINLLYYFNNKHFCFASGYGSGNRHKKSAGTAIIGADAAIYDAQFDFSKLPDALEESEKYPLSSYHLRYTTYCVTGGYSYNWVCNKHFMVNGTVLPKFGVSMSKSNSTTGKHALTAMGIRLMGSVTYYNGNWFISLVNNFSANRFQTPNVAFVSAIENFQLSGGFRFNL